MYAVEENKNKEKSRSSMLKQDQHTLEECLKQLEDEKSKTFLQLVLKEVVQEHMIVETELNIQAIKTCLEQTEEEAKQKDYKSRIRYMQDQLYNMKEHQIAHLAEAEGRVRAQLAHKDQLAFIQQQNKHRKTEKRVTGILPNVPRKNLNRKKYKEKADCSKVISPLEIEKRGCIFFTRDHKEYVHLYNDILINPSTMEVKTFREVLASTLHVRNSEGEMIFKYAKHAFRPVIRRKI
ncbi:hypothetical protein [Listeria booriae]|uniref:Uncharacterized protein n=1 Tax=Listeria booriae TaxID=1552123 RepID=A0A7X1DTJ7_9LIST|nr:hypothetical protein [Listeria booriae]MBC2164847.1 hypothetical protein [Listeria booriae]MBC2373723.1 hypothetical protein [Listeria booriae]